MPTSLEMAYPDELEQGLRRLLFFCIAHLRFDNVGSVSSLSYSDSQSQTNPGLSAPVAEAVCDDATKAWNAINNFYSGL
jgi:hypothetical protein